MSAEYGYSHTPHSRALRALAPYPQLVRAGFRRYATYRQASVAGLATNVVFGLLRAAVLTAVLAGRPSVAG